MKHRLLPAAVCAALLLAACSGNTLLDEEHTFDRNVWNRFTPELFDLSVSNIENYYNIDFTVAVDTAVYRYDALPLMIILQAPGGEERQFYGNITLKEQGRWRGEMRDGYRTVDGRIRSYFSFTSKGTHQMAVSQTTSQYDLEGVHSLSVSIVRAKIDYDL